MSEKKFRVSEVQVSYGMTMNLGNYESFRVDGGLTLRCDKEFATEEEAKKTREEMFEEAWAVAENEVKQKIIAVRKNTQGKSNA